MSTTAADLNLAQSTLGELADVLADWQGRLSALKETIPNPTFEPDTDRPLNEAARLVGTIESVLLDEMATIERAARKAARRVGSRMLTRERGSGRDKE